MTWDAFVSGRSSGAPRLGRGGVGCEVEGRLHADNTPSKLNSISKMSAGVTDLLAPGVG
jgi:hypothetical protein